MTMEISKISYSRKKARKFWEETYSELPRDIFVHHKDLNPLNNNPENLGLMENGEHTSYHASISEKWGRREDIDVKNKRLLSKLESYLIIFNDR